MSFFRREGQFLQEIRALSVKGERDWERVRREQDLVRTLYAVDIREGLRVSMQAVEQSFKELRPEFLQTSKL